MALTERLYYDDQLIIEKQRNGPTGSVKLLWYPVWTRFENLSRAPEALQSPNY